MPTDEPQRILVRKLDTAGHVVVTYEGTLAERLPHGVRLDARWSRAPRALGYTTFEPGDHFIEWYFTDRWYNIFEIHGHSGALKGWYCNIAAPATIDAGVITCRDLLLDLWVAADGRTSVLDEGEFAADTALDGPTRQAALDAFDALCQLVARREPPFDTLPPAR